MNNPIGVQTWESAATSPLGDCEDRSMAQLLLSWLRTALLTASSKLRTCRLGQRYFDAHGGGRVGRPVRHGQLRNAVQRLRAQLPTRTKPRT